ncbi:DUF2971 domain-containing protein [Aporhodopirellula aestuarii]|uniref:DUF2971 domain-containing protein n=1 Tax=Aporhodopirellula aestuarii TaxID=2950107 RepID=A0ABT0U4W6_9BACT|nr:DUF2971 domain-containing protein [Aporhodopirellula aestuarii]MCM2371895.1 DUF2971 domain-containing protein [Aporhodopirellula aestuarii]
MIVHHYTSLPVGLQILEKRELWLSAVTSASDLGEYIFAAEHLKSKVSEWLSDELCQRRFCERLDSFVSLYGADLEEPDLAFYASFTTLEDNATQWIAYGDGGKGISIAFDLDGLRAHGERATSSAVMYGQPGLDRIVENLEGFKAWFHNRESELEHDVDSSEFALAEYLAGHAATQCAYVKSVGFETEKEVRLCVAPVLDTDGDEPKWKIKYRSAYSRLIPYTVHKFQTEVIKSIRLGPFSSHGTNRHAAANMLTDWEYENTIVNISELKMR